MSAPAMTTDVQFGGDVALEELVGQAERSVLGAAMRSVTAYERASALVSGSDFMDPRHATIWNAISDVVAEGTADAPVLPDAVLVAGRLMESGTLATVGGAGYLGRLATELATTENAGYYARIVRDAAQQRAMGTVGMRLTAAGASALTADERSAIVSEAVSTLEDIDAATSAADPYPLLRERLEGLLDIFDGQRPATITTGLAPLDDLLGGLAAGQVIVVGARPGVGKSILGTQVATHVAADLGKPVLMFNLEMSSDEVLTRVLAARASVPSDRLNLEGARLTDADWLKLVEVTPTVLEMPLHAVDDSGLTVERIAALATSFQRKHADLALVVVDYLGLIEASGRRSNRTEEGTAVTRGIKVLARRLGVPILLLAQLNREVTKRAGKGVPQLADLRDSGSVEQDGDIVILLHREDMVDQTSTRAGEVDLIVAKRRGGRTDTVTMAAQPQFFRFVPMGTISTTPPETRQGPREAAAPAPAPVEEPLPM